MTAHRFASSLAVGQRHEAELDAALKAQGRVLESVSRDEQRSGIDRWMLHGGRWWSLEYKADVRAADTGNFALEVVSVLGDDGAAKAGWAVATPADYLLLYRPQHRTALVVPGPALCAWVRLELSSLRIRPVRNEGWWSLVALAPCGRIEALAQSTLKVEPPPSGAGSPIDRQAP